VRIVRGALETRPGGARPVALLQFFDDHGRTGVGAASPLPGYSPDTLDEAGCDLARAVAALPLELDLCLPVAPQVRRLLRGAGLAAPSAAFAFALEPAPLACGLPPEAAAAATPWIEPPERPGLGLDPVRA
jgi:O-succinylbenzoate synthase